MFEQTFKNSLRSLSCDNETIEEYWAEINSKYSEPRRHYHNLTHLNNLLKELEPLKHLISDWTTVVFSVAYHDVVYDVLKNDNEEQSAELAYERLSRLGLPDLQKNRCKEQILATKGHQISNDNDTNLFTDADLSILASSPEMYKQYAFSIRKEYAYYPDAIYMRGRERVLKHFLGMASIYKTDHFRDKYEKQARQNIEAELQELTNKSV